MPEHKGVPFQDEDTRVSLLSYPLSFSASLDCVKESIQLVFIISEKKVAVNGYFLNLQ
ncbi:hypothetical protein EFW57_01795 [Bacillus velezensis]|nr:hypothetical protein EFW57_01795 [Bacillus velezensis]